MTSVETKLGRCQRKTDKLKMQRDHWKKKYDELRCVLDQFPLYEKRYADLQKWKLGIAEETALKQRVKEQAALIERLTREGKV